MPREHTWSELRLGVISAAAIVAIVVLTLLFARVGGVHGKKVTLWVVTDDATGILSGTEVWLAGRKTGLVKKIEFRPPSSDTMERLLIKLETLEKELPNIRKDSWAQIRAGGSLVATPVIYISAGSAEFPQLHDGDTLRTRESSKIGDLASDITDVMPKIKGLTTEMELLNQKVSQPTGTIGNFRTRGFPALPAFGGTMSRLSAKAGGNGTIGLAMRRNLMGRASRAMAQTDSIRALMASDKSSLGRFKKDTALMTKAKGVMAELDTLRGLMSDPVGQIAAAHPDSALTRELARNRALLDSLMKDVKKHPLRYINF
ncbi:MAG TPA: MlaD family protein [Gemmatimonadaceae bacterium]|nr:MlaD family protein [Gemmatimonadaceae bacterium]